MEQTFVTALNCIDGRIQEPVIKYLKEKYGAQYVDMITESGIVKLLAEDKTENVQEKIDISVNKHGSKLIAIVAHDDCVGNPVAKNIQIEQLSQSQNILMSLYPAVEVIKLWIGNNWEVEEI